MRTQPAPEKLIYWTYDLVDILEDVPTSVAAFKHIQDFAMNATVMDRRLTWGFRLAPNQFLVRGKFFGSLEEWNNRIAPELLRTLPTPRSNTTQVREVSWLQSQALFYGFEDIGTLPQPDEPGEYQEHDNFYAKSVTIPEPLTDEAMTEYFAYAANEGSQISSAGKWFSIFNLYGGPDSQINVHDAEWSSYKDRNSLWVAQNYGHVDPGMSYDERLTGFINGLNEAITRKMPDTDFGAYSNYLDPDLTPAEAHELYYGSEIYDRLLDIKRDVDPDQVFYNPQAVGVGDY